MTLDLQVTVKISPGERAPGTHLTGGWVDLIAGLDAMEKKKYFPLLGIAPQSSSL
jgi:hypothetical protein